MEKDCASSVVTSGSEISATASVSSRANYNKNVNKEQKGKQQSGSSSSSNRASVTSKSSRTSYGGSHYHLQQQQRQSNRGGDGGASSTKNTEHGGAVAKAELGSVSRPGSKKGGGACDYAPFYNNNKRRGGYRRFDGANETYTHHYGQRNRNSSLCYGPSYNKEQYLQATCQFVVMEGFNYAAHISDADLLVDWDRIEELRLAADEIPCCPICLYPPSSAKITRCGHVFCWPCILHYLALSDKAWRKCPICYESVYKNQLKSVAASLVTRFDLGGEITMTLMRREKGSNIVLPATTNEEDSPRNKQWELVNGAYAPFSKLLLISRDQVIEKVVARERGELLLKLAEDEHEPEVCFVREALDSLDEREKLLKTTKSPTEKSPAGSASPPAQLFSPSGLHSTEVFIDAFNDEKRSGGSCSVRSAKSAPAYVPSAAGAAGRCASSQFNNNLSTDECPPEDYCYESAANSVDMLATAATSVAAAMNDKFYYFYQAQDGQQIYLHPITARCFIRQYGTLSAAPAAITGLIMDAESFVMTEDTRRRYRYLSHLPLTAAFKLVELKLPTSLLSAETMKLFSADFAKREDARQRKAKEEKKRQTQAERWERAVMLDPRNYSKYTSSNIVPPDIPITTYVPSAQRDIQASLSSSSSGGVLVVADTNVTAAACSDTAQSFPPLTGSPPESSWSTPSFAQMLRHGKPKPVPPPTSPQPSSSSSQPGRANGIAGTDDDLLDEEQREFLHSHALQQDTFGDAIQFALDKYRRVAEGDAAEVSAAASNSRAGKKKKKAKGRVLLSM